MCAVGLPTTLHAAVGRSLAVAIEATDSVEKVGCYRMGEAGYHWYCFCFGRWLYPHLRVCRQATAGIGEITRPRKGAPCGGLQLHSEFISGPAMAGYKNCGYPGLGSNYAENLYKDVAIQPGAQRSAGSCDPHCAGISLLPGLSRLAAALRPAFRPSPLSMAGLSNH